ncbi:hypothetical protein [Lactococcus muris]|uniref:hypothetical protein n=1 Tax=Lactococcus muris TaxID=2941330 RepID=UPI0023008279
MKKSTKTFIAFCVSVVSLVLIGGTFAYTDIAQRALNMLEGEPSLEYGGRVHDYFDDVSGNKDVFVENFGSEALLARVKFTELFTQNGVSLVQEGSIDINDPMTWPTWIPGPEASASPGGTEALGTRIGSNAPINAYFHLQLGQATHGTNRPWFMPTFNLDSNSIRTATAGAGIDVETGGATHPGEGTANYWTEGMFDASIMGPPESPEQHETRQVLEQERPPMTFAQWQALRASDRVGHFWVIDQETGWAYWADLLLGGQATSFLLDSKVVQPALSTLKGEGSYQIHAIGQFSINDPAYLEEFWTEDMAASLNTANGQSIIQTIQDMYG